MARDGTAEPVLRDQILSANWDREIFMFCSAGHEQDWIGNLTRWIQTLLLVMTIHTHILSLGSARFCQFLCLLLSKGSGSLFCDSGCDIQMLKRPTKTKLT